VFVIVTMTLENYTNSRWRKDMRSVWGDNFVTFLNNAWNWLNSSLRKLYESEHDFTSRIVSFVSRQEPETVVMLILFASLFTAFGLIYLYYIAQTERRRVNYWRKRYTLLRSTDIVRVYEMKSLKENLKIAKQDAESLTFQLEESKKKEGIVITDSDREDLAESFATIIKTLDGKNKVAMRELIILAKKFDIEITFGDSEQTDRKRPRRAAAPTKFHFSDNEEEDDDKNDHDYKP
jgi:hypothetical protein